MRSGEGERVPFTVALNPLDKNVEDWMQELEDFMRTAVKRELKKALSSFHNVARTDWV